MVGSDYITSRQYLCETGKNSQYTGIVQVVLAQKAAYVANTSPAVSSKKSQKTNKQSIPCQSNMSIKSHSFLSAYLQISGKAVKPAKIPLCAKDVHKSVLRSLAPFLKSDAKQIFPAHLLYAH